jgi:hypothetical protein
MRLIFEDQEAFDSVARDIEVTAAVEGGAGAVRLGTPARLGDGRLAVSHPFTQIDAIWITAYANDLRLTVVSEED